MKNSKRTSIFAFVIFNWLICFSQTHPDAKYSEGVLLNRKANGFKGIWYMNQPSNDEYVYKYSGGMAVYPANHRPFAIYSKKANKTFFCFGGTNEQNSTLLHCVSYFDHKSKLVANPTVVLDKNTTDAHDNPVISLDDKGYIYIFSTSHGTGRPSYISRSCKPYNIEKFEMLSPTEIVDGEKKPFSNFSYFQVYFVKGKGFIALFTKYDEKNRRVIGFNTSPDAIEWGEWKKIADYELGHYQVSDCCNGVVGTAFDFHPEGKGLNWRTNLQFLRTCDFGKSWETADGTKIEIPLKEKKNAAVVHNFQQDQLNCYLSDILIDNKAKPYILIIDSKGFESGPQNGPRQWHLFSYANNQWQDAIVTTSDNNYDMGSVYKFNNNEILVVGPSDDGPQQYNTGGEIVKWCSEDGGRKWERAKTVTKNSNKNHCYVRRPLMANPDFIGIWADGNGRKPSSSYLYICDRQGNVYQLPQTFTQATVKPTLVSF